MNTFFDQRESRSLDERAAEIADKLPGVVAKALRQPGWAKHLGSVNAQSFTSIEALATLPVLRKSDLPRLHAENPPFGGIATLSPQSCGRLFMSPGPIFEAESTEPDAWCAARALYAAGFREGDVALNTFSYHLTPGGFIMDSGARALGCPVIPSGPGNTEAQLRLIGQFAPAGYLGTPDFLKIILDAGEAAGAPVTSIRKAVVSGAAFPPSLRDELAGRGVNAYQAYATADVGIVAYETPAREGLVVNEDFIIEIVRPGTGDPVAVGEVGEVLITTLNAHHPFIRFALGDLSAIMPGPSPCGRTNRRIRGWLGRADQTTKVKGMFIRPEQIADLMRRHPEIQRMRLVVSRENDTDVMVLKAEAAASGPQLEQALGQSLQTVTALKGRVEIVPPGSLPNDGKVISDERPVAS